MPEIAGFHADCETAIFDAVAFAPAVDVTN
jgi:hypothetical protein